MNDVSGLASQWKSEEIRYLGTQYVKSWKQSKQLEEALFNQRGEGTQASFEQFFDLGCWDKVLKPLEKGGLGLGILKGKMMHCYF